MRELERRYARLLSLYPAAYRRSRGAEMLAVLMASAPAGRERPEWRQVRSLILGALRVRAGAHGHRTPGQSWRVSLRTAALMLLIVAGGNVLWQSTSASLRLSAVVAAACALAIAAILRGWYLPAVAITAVAFGLDAFGRRSVYDLSSTWPLPLAVLLLAPLVGRGRMTVPRSLNWLLAVPLISVAMDAYGTLTRDPSFQTGGRAVWQVLAVAAVLWSVVDERVALTLGLAFLYVVVSRAMGDLALIGSRPAWGWTLADMGVLAVLPVLDIVIGATLAVRRARL